MLLLAGHNINARNRGNWTPLHYASENGHVDMVRLLIEWGGVELNVRECNGKTALGWAISEGHTEIERLLRDKGALE